MTIWVVVAAVSTLLAFGLFFWVTHSWWYDGMTAEVKANFWAQFFVAWGTSALAVVTCASVYETQQVLRGEDIRFMQSLQPVVVAARDIGNVFVRVDDGYLSLTFENIGLGPARDVALVLEAIIEYDAPGDPTATNPDDRPHTGVERLAVPGVLIFSYLETRVKRSWYHQCRDAKGTISRVTVERLTINFDDLFGWLYIVDFPNFDREPQRFVLEGPIRTEATSR